MTQEKILKEERLTDRNGTEWLVLKIEGRWGPLWAIQEEEAEDWGFPFFASRKDAINEIELISLG